MIAFLQAFRHMSKRHGIAVRHQANMGVRGSVDQRDDALDEVKKVENEFAECFVMVKRPPSMGQGGL